jgi:hypothetical protein
LSRYKNPDLSIAGGCNTCTRSGRPELHAELAVRKYRNAVLLNTVEIYPTSHRLSIQQRHRTRFGALDSPILNGPVHRNGPLEKIGRGSVLLRKMMHEEKCGQDERGHKEKINPKPCHSLLNEKNVAILGPIEHGSKPQPTWLSRGAIRNPEAVVRDWQQLAETALAAETLNARLVGCAKTAR